MNERHEHDLGARPKAPENFWVTPKSPKVLKKIHEVTYPYKRSKLQISHPKNYNFDSPNCAYVWRAVNDIIILP